MFQWTCRISNPNFKLKIYISRTLSNLWSLLQSLKQNIVESRPRFAKLKNSLHLQRFSFTWLILVYFIFVSGVLGNTYTILVMVFRKRLYNCCTPYLIGVSISDLVMTAVVLPVVGLNAVTGKIFVPSSLCMLFSVIYHDILGKNYLRIITF